MNCVTVLTKFSKYTNIQITIDTNTIPKQLKVLIYKMLKSAL